MAIGERAGVAGGDLLEVVPFGVGVALTLLAGSAYAQGNSPYNASGSQAGGPRGGMERAGEAAAMERGIAPASRPVMRRQMKRKRMMKHHRRMRHHM